MVTNNNTRSGQKQLSQTGNQSNEAAVAGLGLLGITLSLLGLSKKRN